MREMDRLHGMVGRLVVFKARNIKAAEWERGILEGVSEQELGDVRLHVRMRDKQLHDLPACDFEIDLRAH